MATVTSKGQITLPKEIRQRLGLKAGSQVDFVVEDGRVVLQRRVPTQAFDRWAGYLKDRFPTKASVDEFMGEIRGERLPWPPTEANEERA